MGIESVYLEDLDLTVAAWDGTVTASEWERTVRENLAADPKWPRGRRHLADLTTFDPSELTTDDIATVTAIMSAHVANFVGRRQAIIIAGIGWDLARAFERRIAQSGATTIVFDTLNGACDWLGVDPTFAGEVLDELRDEAREASHDPNAT